jgi:hypothetical protein
LILFSYPLSSIPPFPLLLPSLSASTSFSLLLRLLLFLPWLPFLKVKLSWDQLVDVFESALQAENLEFASCFASHPRLLPADSPSKSERFHRSKQQLQHKLENRRRVAIGSETETKGTKEGREGRVSGGEVLEEVEEVAVEEVRMHYAM